MAGSDTTPERNVSLQYFSLFFFSTRGGSSVSSVMIKILDLIINTSEP